MKINQGRKVSLSLDDFKRKVDQISDVEALDKIAGAVLSTCHPDGGDGGDGGGGTGGGGGFTQFTRTGF